MKILLVLLTGILFTSFAAAQSTSRTCVDGTPFPPVVFQTASLGVRNKQAKKLDLINSYLNRLPEELGKGILSAQQSDSQQILEKLMSRYEEFNTKSSFTNGLGGQSSEVHHHAKQIVDTLPSKWFIKGLAGTGANVVGVDLTDGVISRMTLYYQRPTTSKIVNMLIDAARSENGKKFIYRVFQRNGVTYFDALATAPIYLASHPHMSNNIRQAMEKYTLIDGMELEQAVALFGTPDIHYKFDGNVTVSCVEIGGMTAFQYTLHGRPACTWTLIDGTVWTAIEQRDGTIYNVERSGR